MVVYCWWQGPQPTEVGKRGGEGPAMWAVGYVGSGNVELSPLNSVHNLELTTGGWVSELALQALLPAGPEFPITPFKTFGSNCIRNQRGKEKD